MKANGLLRQLSLVSVALSWLLLPGAAPASQVPGAFVDVGIGARPVGMGGAYVGAADDLNSILWNPAGLASVANRQVLFSHMKQLSLVPYSCGVFGQPLGAGQAFAAGVLTSGDEVMREHTILVGYGRGSEGASKGGRGYQVGTTAKLRISTFGGDAAGGADRVTGHALGVGLDLGAKARPARYLTVGLVVKDLFAPVQWTSSVKGGYIESVPRTVVAGMALSDRQRFTLAADLENTEMLSVGAEIVALDIISFRGGYRWPLSTEWDKSYAVGCGLRQLFRNGLSLQADLSVSFEELATTSRFSLTAGF